MILRPADTHPLGCHRPRISDRLCFWGILVRLVTGASWVTVEAILDRRVSDTTLRSRRDEWVEAGVFDELRDHALEAYDRIIGLDLSEVALDGSLHKAPCGGEGTGKSPVDRAKLGLEVVGGGRTPTVFRWGGRSTVPTAMTSNSLNSHWPTSPGSACWAR
jgi:hypothetical protein